MKIEDLFSFFTRWLYTPTNRTASRSGKNFQPLEMDKWTILITLPETNIAHENPIFPGKYHQNGGFSMAMLVSGSVVKCYWKKDTPQGWVQNRIPGP